MAEMDFGVSFDFLDLNNCSATPMDSYFPDFLSTEDKYNDVIRETCNMDKFMSLVMKIASDPKVSADRLVSLTQFIERDLKLVHNIDDFRSFLKVIHSMVDFMKASKS